MARAVAFEHQTTRRWGVTAGRAIETTALPTMEHAVAAMRQVGGLRYRPPMEPGGGWRLSHD